MTLNRDNKPHIPPLRRPMADHGPKERWQHAGRTLQVTEMAGVLAARVSEENGLDRALAAGQVDAVMHEAGLMLRADYQAAQVEQRIIASYSAARVSRVGGYHEPERSDAEERAYQRWRRALQAVDLMEGRVLLSACCQEQMPQTPAGWHYLRRGLGRLIGYYGLKAN